MKNFIKFDKTYDVSKLEAELEYCLADLWVQHFNSNDYGGQWKCISLRSESGIAQDIRSNYGVESYQDTPLLDKIPYIKSIIDSWPCDKESVRLMALYPSSEIKPHRDQGCSYLDGTFRLHIPIITDPLVEFYLDGERLALVAGECWYMDFSKVHHIRNKSEIVRVHLVIDAVRNEKTDVIFSDYDAITEVREEQYDAQTKQRIIAELERLNTDVSRQLIRQMKENG